MKGLPARRVVVPFVVLACAIYLPKAVWPSSALYVHILPPERLRVLGSFAKLVCLGVGALFCFRSATRFETGNPARLPWQSIGSWLALWTIGQLVLTVYALRLVAEPPGASVADAAFVAGFVPLFAGQIRFIFVYRASGFPLGSAREHLLIAACAALVLGALSHAVLAPALRSEGSLVDRLVYVAYPVLDLAALVPTIVMIRIAFAFRPGKVWTVWAALLVGFGSIAIGDVVSAFLSSGVEDSYNPWIHLTWLLGYFFMACGAKLQYELLTA
jgi:hypothetical protein